MIEEQRFWISGWCKKSNIFKTCHFCLCFYWQVFQQALHRQPNTAAQYLQQMYAAQQQHLMLQTAALQQQHSLSTAQLQSLAAVQQVSKQSPQIIHSLSLVMTTAVVVDLLQDVFQKLHITHCPSCLPLPLWQASIAAGRQSSSQNGTSSQQTGSTQATVSAAWSAASLKASLSYLCPVGLSSSLIFLFFLFLKTSRMLAAVLVAASIFEKIKLTLLFLKHTWL